MTAQAERLKASHRGFVHAEPASRSRIRQLQDTGRAFEIIDDFTIIVVGKYLLNPAASHWHRIDDPSCHGYLVSALDADIKRNSEKPAEGRDSDTALSHTSTSGPRIVAESSAGTVSPSEASASLLPVVSL